MPKAYYNYQLEEMQMAPLEIPLSKEYSQILKKHSRIIRKGLIIHGITDEELAKRLRAFFALAEVPYQVKLHMAYKWEWQEEARIWEFENLDFWSLDHLAQSAPPRTADEVKAFLLNPQTFLMFKVQGKMVESLFLRALYSSDFFAQESSLMVIELLLEGAIEQSHLTVELACAILDQGKGAWMRILLQWIRETYDLENYPDSFLVDFIYMLKEIPA